MVSCMAIFYPRRIKNYALSASLEESIFRLYNNKYTVYSKGMKNMSQKAAPVKSFKDNLSHMFFRYALSPVVQLMIFVIILAVFTGAAFVKAKNRETSREISQNISSTFEKYESLLNELCLTDGIINPVTSSTKRQKIVRKLYQASIDTGFSAGLHILDSSLEPCVSTDSNAESSPQGESAKLKSAAYDMAQEPGKTVFSAKSIGSSPVIYMGRALCENGAISGYVILSFPAGEFAKTLSNYNRWNLLIDQNGWVFSANNSAFTDAVGRLAKGLSDKSGFFAYNSGFYYLTRSDIYKNSLTLYTVTPLTESVNILFSIVLTGITVLLIVSFVTFQKAEKMFEESTRDLITLNDSFKKVMAGDLNCCLDIQSSTEFKSIGECYNRMLSSLKNQIAANKELSETVAYTQVKQLESQFNSHFLFNTLDNIRFMCKIDADMAQFMAVSLSELLRYNTSTANEKVTIAEDLKYIRTYLEIIHIRFGDRFDYSIELQTGIEELIMPKLLLQPIIENSIKYGFGNREHLTMSVKGLKCEDTLHFICEDDGVGIPAELLKKLQQDLTQPRNRSSHLGLYNVNRRLQLMYGESYGIKLESDNGVKVSVSLPAEQISEKSDG